MIDFLFEQSRGILNLNSIPEPAVALNISKTIHDRFNDAGFISADVLAAAQQSWRMNQERAENVKYIFAYYKRGDRRLILGAFIVDGADAWMRSADGTRMIFLGFPAPDRSKFELYELPQLPAGARNPVKYYD